jgi:glycosyltransferase involved in cell wall biosynthesis
MRKLKIAQVTNLQEAVPPINQHGLEQLVFDLTEELIDLGHEVTLFATADSKTRAKLVPIWPKATRHDPLSSKIDSQTFAIWSVAEAMIRHTDFDVIHSHAGYVFNQFAGAISTPVISTEHNPVSYDFIDQFPTEYQKYFTEIEQKHFSKNHTVAISNFQASCFRRPVTTIQNGIRLTNWPYSQNTQRSYLGFLGYITPDKGVSEAIQAVLPTKERLLIAGPLDTTPKNQAYFDEKIKPFLSERIQYVGPLGFDEKKKFYSEAKAILMPIQWDEPFGLVALESLASGTPVIGWKRAALPEIITDGKTGFLTTSVSEMTQKISQLEKLTSLDCRQSAEEKFSATLMAKKYEEFYYSLIR